jgi:hypothetical protein
LEAFGIHQDGLGIGIEPDILIAPLTDPDSTDGGIITQIIQGPVLDRHIQIKGGIADGRLVIPFLPQFEKDVIDDLFGRFFLMDDGIAEAEQPNKVEPVQRFKSSFTGRFDGVTNQIFNSCDILKVIFFNFF